MKTYLLIEDGQQIGIIELDSDEVRTLENIGFILKEV